MVTPNRPDATCLIALRRESPFSSGSKRCGSSPPSPEFDFAADPVHRDRERLVRLGADRAERHRAGHEPRDDRARPARPRRAGSASPPVVDLEQAAQRDERVRPRRRTAARTRRTRARSSRAHRGLQRRDRRRVPLVELAAAPPPVLAADRQVVGDRVRRAPKPRAWRSSASRPSSSRPMPPMPRRRAGEPCARSARGRARPPRRSARRDSSAPSRCPSWTSP